MSHTISTRPGVGCRDRPAGAWLFVTSACFYLLCTSGHIFAPDGVIMFQVTRAIIDRGEVSIRGLEGRLGFGGTRHVGEDGSAAFYAKYGLGMSLAAFPTYALGRLIAPLLDRGQLDLFRIEDTQGVRVAALARGEPVSTDPHGEFRALWYDPGADQARQGFLAFCAAWTNSLVVAGIVLGVFLSCRALDCSPRVSLGTAALAGVATPLWAYAKDFFSEPLAGLGLTYFFYYAVCASRGRRTTASWVLSGISLGVVALTKPALVVLVAPAALLVGAYLRPLPRAEAVQRAAEFAVGLAAVVSIIPLYNYVRFESVLETGYAGEAGEWTSPFLVGLFGLLGSPGRGFLIYFPLWLLLFPGGQMFAAARRTEFIYIAVSFAVLLVLYANWHSWEGGLCWGPWFLLPCIPLLVISLSAYLKAWPSQRSSRVFGSLVIALAFVVALSGVLVNYWEYANWVEWQVTTRAPWFVAQGITNPYQLVVMDPWYAPVIAHWTFPRRDYFFVMDALRHPGLILGIYAVFAGGFLVGLTRLQRAMAKPSALKS